MLFLSVVPLLLIKKRKSGLLEIGDKKNKQKEV